MNNYDIKYRWLISESIDGSREYIVHTQWPRFIGLVEDDDGGVVINKIQWLDEPHHGEAARLMREAGEAWAEYYRKLDADLKERDYD